MLHSLSYAVMLLRREFTDYCSQRLKEAGLSQGQLFFILYVGKHPGCAPKELAAALHLDQAHTTRSLVRLKQDGFLLQEPNPVDRRAHTLVLTPKGQQAFQLSHDLFVQWDADMMSGMDPAAREKLTEDLYGLLHGKWDAGCAGSPVKSCESGRMDV